MEYDTETPPYKTSDRTSFAYVSARDRWPVILTSAIDDVHQETARRSGQDEQEEGKRVVQALATLKYELQHDRHLTPLPDEGQPDIADYNSELQALGEPKWFDVPWLYAECYLYRRVATIFASTTHWKSYDVFFRQKLSTFKSSRPAVLELASRYKGLITQLEEERRSAAPQKTGEERETAERILFIEMCEICLWGNATDLSLLTSLTYEDIQKLQGSQARKASEKNILVNDLDAVYDTLNAARRHSRNSRDGNEEGDSRRVDIILDNAGFELFVDLVLAGYLLAANLATTIVLHPKSIPWFVSDALPADFAALLNALADPQKFYAPPSGDHNAAERPPPLTDAETDDLSFLFQHWSSLHAEGKLIMRPNKFWTQAGSFWRLPFTSPDLFEDLKKSEVAIFKGDLNYRKLTGDAQWPPTTPFETALGPLGRESGIRSLALRTCKADVVVGLPEGQDEKLRESENAKDSEEERKARKWAWSGKWAVVQFCDGRGP